MVITNLVHTFKDCLYSSSSHENYLSGSVARQTQKRTSTKNVHNADKETDAPNLGEDIRQVLNTQSFEQTFDGAGPYLIASLGSWPGYWVYRGFDWHTHRPHVTLPIYIRQTFYQAKMLQFAIILSGLLGVLGSQTFQQQVVAMELNKQE